MDLCQHCTEHDTMGGMLCPGCTKTTRVRLEALPVLYRGLAPLLTPSASIGQGRTGKGGPAPIPVTLDVLDIRGPGGMTSLLESWVDAVRHERRRPEQPHNGSPQGRVDRATGELLGHLPWIAVSWSEAGEFAREIQELARSVSSIIRPAAPTERGTRVGRCPAQHEDGTLCGAVLRLGHGERVVTCAWCGTSYPPATWIGLKVLIDEDTRAGNAA